MDTFPVAGIRDDGNITVLPGYQVYHRFNIVFLFVDFDCAVINVDKFFFYPGLGILVGGTDEKYDRYYPLYKNESYEGGEVLIGFRFRLGAQYMLTEYVGVALEIGHSRYLYSNKAFLNHSDIGLGVYCDF